MLRFGTFLWCAVALCLPLMAPSKASEVCPPRTSTYGKCPQGFRQNWPIPPSYWIDTDTVVEQVADDLWEYHWCLKSTATVDDDIYFLWRDHKWEGRTSCGGFWGHSLQTTFSPSDERLTTVVVGPDLTEIQPTTKLPLNQIPPPAFFHRIKEYITKFFVSLPLDKTGDNFTTTGLTIRSSATPVLKEDEWIETQYRLEYSDALADNVSAIRFAFSDNIIKQASELDGLFSLSNKMKLLEFTEPRLPANVIGAIVFVDLDGYEVGSMPVSLAIPSD